MPALLHQHGFLYDSSLMDSDFPYELAVDADSTDSIIELPIEWTLDDWEQYCYLPDISGSGIIASPSIVQELWTSAFRGLHREGGCFILTNQPFLSGRPGRIDSLSTLMAEVTKTPGVWTTTLADIARHTRSLGLVPRTVEYPEL